MLHDSNSALVEEQEQSQKMPAVLFRYTKVEYLAPILEGRGLFFPKLSSFNDPFDANIFPIFKATNNEYRNFYNAMLKSSGLSRATRRNRLRENKCRLNETLMKAAYERTIRETRDECGVLCLAESRCDILMWSHYALGRTGVFLAFDTANTFFSEASRVTYQSEYPAVDFAWFSEKLTDSLGVNGTEKRSAGHAAIDRALFLTKAAHWKYEAEWRIAQKFPRPLKDDENGIYFPFPEESLIGIAIGASATDSAVATVRKQVESASFKPQLFRAQASKTKYALEFLELK